MVKERTRERNTGASTSSGSVATGLEVQMSTGGKATGKVSPLYHASGLLYARDHEGRMWQWSDNEGGRGGGRFFRECQA